MERVGRLETLHQTSVTSMVPERSEQPAWILVTAGTRRRLCREDPDRLGNVADDRPTRQGHGRAGRAEVVPVGRTLISLAENGTRQCRRGTTANLVRIVGIDPDAQWRVTERREVHDLVLAEALGETSHIRVVVV